MAVLVDNFQRTITAVEVKPHKKQSGLQFKSVFEEVCHLLLLCGTLSPDKQAGSRGGEGGEGGRKGVGQ